MRDAPVFDGLAHKVVRRNVKEFHQFTRIVVRAQIVSYGILLERVTALNHFCPNRDDIFRFLCHGLLLFIVLACLIGCGRPRPQDRLAPVSTFCYRFINCHSLRPGSRGADSGLIPAVVINIVYFIRGINFIFSFVCNSLQFNKIHFRKLSRDTQNRWRIHATHTPCQPPVFTPSIIVPTRNLFRACLMPILLDFTSFAYKRNTDNAFKLCNTIPRAATRLLTRLFTP